MTAPNVGVTPFIAQTLQNVAPVDLTVQAAAIVNQALFGVPAIPAQPSSVNPPLGVYSARTRYIYNIDWLAVLTQAATTSSTLGGAGGFTVTYTDNDTGAPVTTSAVPLVNSAANLLGTQISGQVLIDPVPGTLVSFSFGYTSSGATVMQYALHVRVEPIG